jgi:hypothetical protein
MLTPWWLLAIGIFTELVARIIVGGKAYGLLFIRGYGSIFAIYMANGRFNPAHFAEAEYSPADLSMLQDSAAPRRDELAQRK